MKLPINQLSPKLRTLNWVRSKIKEPNSKERELVKNLLVQLKVAEFLRQYFNPGETQRMKRKEKHQELEEHKKIRSEKINCKPLDYV